MKEFIDKLLSRLEEEKGIAFLTLANTGNKTKDIVYGEVMAYLNTAIDMVNELAEEYINTSTISKMENVGWIPCSERLPKADHYVLCQGNNSMFVACVDSFDGEWRDNHFYKRTNVKAWCELPAPYTEGE